MTAISSVNDVSCDENKCYYTSEVSKIVETLCECPIEALNKIIKILKFIKNLMNETVKSEISENNLSKLVIDSKNLINKKKSENIVGKPRNIIVTNCKIY